MVLTLPDRHRRIDLTLIFGLAVLLRATLLFTTPSLSDDIYRSV